MANKITRRQLLLGTGVAIGAAAVGFPLLKQISQDRPFWREDYPPPPPEVPAGHTYWANWSGIHPTTPRLIASVDDEDALRRLVAVESDPKLKLRPVGSGHSFSALVPTDGILVDVSRINGLTNITPIPPALRTGDYTAIATFGAGTRLSQAVRELSRAGYALPNLPDIDVQTLAGTFATATHGTGSNLTALHDYIESARLVTATGEVLTISRTENSNLFAAALVSLGALGIITEYRLRVVPAFFLRRRIWIERLSGMLSRAASMALEHRNFEFFYFTGTKYAVGIVHDLHEGPVSGRGPSRDDDMLADLKRLRDIVGWSPQLRRFIARFALPKGIVEDYTDASWRLLATARPVKFNEMEYEIPQAQGLETLKRIVKLLDKRNEAFFPIEVRFIAADKTAWLSPFNDGPRIAISVHAAVEEPYDYFFTDLEPVFREASGRPHWGKLHSLKNRQLRDLYPRLDDFARIRHELDPTDRLLNSHLAGLL